MLEGAAAVVTAHHPIRLRVTDDLRRTRLTAAFRPVLAISHLLWLALLTVVVVPAAIVNWVATLVQGISPLGLHTFLAGYLRYGTHTAAYLFLIADPFPGFYLINLKEDYPIDLEVDPPVDQNRWMVAFRIVVAVPALIITNILRSLSGALAVFSWFVALAQARVPEGVRNFAVLALRFEVQTTAYLALVSPRYPNFDVAAA